MSSSSPPPASVLATKPKQKKKTKDNIKAKAKSKEKVIVQASASEPGQGHSRNEGIDPNWAYKPPDNTITFDTSQIAEEFDWDALKNDEDKELWIMRLPEGFKLKNLEGVQVQQPRDARAGKLTTLERKRAKYDVWSVDTSLRVDEHTGEDVGQPPRGEEIKSVTCLLPRKKKGGKLYIAPKPIAQHIIVTHAPATPHVDAASAPAPSTRHCVPKHLLKHRFLPYGAVASADSVHRPTEPMEIDAADVMGGTEELIGSQDAELPSPAEKRTPKKKKALPSSQPATVEKTGKKRKTVAGGESETMTPTKSKKIKV